ncbi:MAG: hypothetical protein U9Q03_04350 [Patescibacteria group bacterium]|nr:hypothetical protein [Patescibacteria group bacterium]
MKKIPKLDISVTKVLKIAGIVVVGVVVLTLALRLLGSSFQYAFRGVSPSKVVPMTSSLGLGMEEMAMDSSMGIGLSMRNVAPSSVPVPPPDGGHQPGDDAEDFEVKEYSSTIETRHLDDTCKTVADLKIKDYIIFERSNEHETGCNYTFKVAHDNANEILAVIESLDPRDLSETSYSIKRQLEDFTSEADILKAKLAAIDETVAIAIAAYDDITILATKTQDVENLARIIDSKIRIIERLTQERININSRLERIERAKALQVDRMEYTYFRVSIYESKFIDGQVIKDSWKATLQAFVRDINDVAQDISLNLILLMIKVLLYALYILIILVVVKYGWKIGKYVWKR